MHAHAFEVAMCCYQARMFMRADSAAGYRIQVHDCVVEMAEQIHGQTIHSANWSLSSFNPKTKLPQVLDLVRYC
jgi:hypothetical protein